MHTLVGSVLLIMWSSAPASADEWNKYLNEKYGFWLSYPTATFVLDRTSEAGDGVLFKGRSSDAKLLIGVLPNTDRYSPSSYQKLIAQNSYGDFRIDYRKRGKTWLALSGENDTTVFYEKVHFACAGTRIVSFAVLYPRAQKRVFDPIVERMEDSFQPGSVGCEPPPANDAARAETDQQRKWDRPTEPRRSKNFNRRENRGAYASLADRITRSRGKNVVVILRRNGPPYDYKVVRGYR
jgi:hypothetical protein